MSDTLDITDGHHGTYRIAWFIDGHEGATLGDGGETAAQLAKKIKAATGSSSEAKSSREYYSASLVMFATDGMKRDSRGFYWESISDAKAALKVARLAVKNCDHPWPDWAIKAKAAGWSPPRGWKP